MTLIYNKKIKKFYFFLLLVLVMGFVWTQSEKINEHLFSQTDRLADTLDLAQALAVDSEGNVYVTGYSYGIKTNYDYATVKYDTHGHRLWVARYNGLANRADYAQALALDDDGNVYVTGHSNGNGTSLDSATIKYDSSGHQLWVRRYNGPADRDDYGQAVSVDSAGNVFVAGNSFRRGTEHDYITIKYDSKGKRLWVARYNPPRNRDDALNALVLDAFGNAYVTGCDRVRDTSYDIATIKYDQNGKQVWLARYSGPEESFDYAQAIALDSSGNVYVSGYSYEGEAEYDYVTIKYDQSGKELWSKKYDGPASRIDSAVALALDESGYVFVTGKSYGIHSASDYGTIKYDSQGNQIWVKRYDGQGNGGDIPCSLVVDPSGNVIVTGLSWGKGTEQDYATIKYDSSGKQLWEARYNGQANRDDFAKALTVDAKGNVYVTGYSYGKGTDYDYLTIKYDPQGKRLWEARYLGK